MQPSWTHDSPPYRRICRTSCGKTRRPCNNPRLAAASWVVSTTSGTPGPPWSTSVSSISGAVTSRPADPSAYRYVLFRGRRLCASQSSAEEGDDCPHDLWFVQEWSKVPAGKRERPEVTVCPHGRSSGSSVEQGDLAHGVTRTQFRPVRSMCGHLSRPVEDEEKPPGAFALGHNFSTGLERHHFSCAANSLQLLLRKVPEQFGSLQRSNDLVRHSPYLPGQDDYIQKRGGGRRGRHSR